MSWKIRFHKKAEKEFDDLPDSMRRGFEYLFERIEKHGIMSLALLHSKPVDDGIWELRTQGKDGIARSLYVTEAEQTVRILLVFAKKTQKTPRRFIELAQKRRSEADV